MSTDYFFPNIRVDRLTSQLLNQEDEISITHHVRLEDDARQHGD